MNGLWHPNRINTASAAIFNSIPILVTEMQRACKQLTKVELFDIYRGEKLGADKKSMAFSLSFQPADKPLTPDEIDRFVKKILGNLKFKLGIEIRE